jgi:hypothetical protein
VLFDSRGGGGALGERASKRQMAKRYALMIGNPSGVPASEAGGVGGRPSLPVLGLWVSA